MCSPVFPQHYKKGQEGKRKVAPNYQTRIFLYLIIMHKNNLYDSHQDTCQGCRLGAFNLSPLMFLSFLDLDDKAAFKAHATAQTVL